MLFPTQRQSYGCLPPYEDRRLGNDEGCTVYLFCDRLVQLLFLCSVRDKRHSKFDVTNTLLGFFNICNPTTRSTPTMKFFCSVAGCPHNDQSSTHRNDLHRSLHTATAADNNGDAVINSIFSSGVCIKHKRSYFNANKKKKNKQT